MKHFHLALALGCAIPVGAASHATAPITVWTSHRLEYGRGDVRQINVYLPDGYAADPGRRYPVLYLIDGGLMQDFLHIAGTSRLGAMWGRSQSVIVVGIETKDRRAELIGSPGNAAQRKAYPTAGHSAKFRAYIRDKVKPLVAAQYRTNGSDGVLGESLAGLFIVDTWLHEPSLFGSYAAISPSIWWEDGAVVKDGAGVVGSKQAGRRILIATEDQGPESRATFARLTALLTKQQGWCYAVRPELTHATIYHAVSPEALQFLFPPGEAPDPQSGFEVRCSRKS